MTTNVIFSRLGGHYADQQTKPDNLECRTFTPKVLTILFL